MQIFFSLFCENMFLYKNKKKNQTFRLSYDSPSTDPDKTGVYWPRQECCSKGHNSGSFVSNDIIIIIRKFVGPPSVGQMDGRPDA